MKQGRRSIPEQRALRAEISVGRTRTARLAVASLVASACFGLATAAHADEGGGGLYVPGYIGPMAGFTPPPGAYGGYSFYLYNGDATANASASRPVSLPGTDFKLPAQVTGSLKLTTPNLNAHLLSFTYVAPQPVLGGNAGIAILLPYVDARLRAASNGVLALTGPAGDTFTLPFSGERSASDSDIGDVGLTGLIGWHTPKVHTMVMLNVYAPTGAYDRHRAVNTGKNHWAVEPMGAITYLDPKTGLELSAAAGITFNATNSATHYRSGDDLHVDFAAIQHLSPTLYLGLVGYDYTQISGDSGSGASGAFKGQVFGLGPVVGGAIPLGPKHMLNLNARYYWEMGAKNRLEGQALFLSTAVNF